MHSKSNIPNPVADFSSAPSISPNAFILRTDTFDSNRPIDANQIAVQSPGHFSSTVSNVELPNSALFNFYLNNSQQQQTKSIYDALQSNALEYGVSTNTILSSEIPTLQLLQLRLKCENEIKQCAKPLLGLNYIIEFQFENAVTPQYVCNLCHCKLSSPHSMVAHVLSIEHQRKFLNIHYPDTYNRVITTSHVHSEQQRLIEKYSKQIQSHQGDLEHIQLHIQLNSIMGQKPLVFAVTFRTPTQKVSNSEKQSNIELASKTFEDYDYSYQTDTLIDEKKIPSQPVVHLEQGSMLHGLSAEDLLYPFDRQYWYTNYNDLLQSRPIDPHSVTYQEIIPESNGLHPFSLQPNHKPSPVTDAINENHLTLENNQTIRKDPNQLSNRRVILDSNRTSYMSTHDLLITVANEISPSYDDSSLPNNQQKRSNGTDAVLNETSARAILAASGLLNADEEEEDKYSRSLMLSASPKSSSKTHPETAVSSSIAKRMLDAVLSGDLDVVHIQPYFSTFVNLIQSGQVELERHQAERLLHKVLVASSSSPPIKKEVTYNNQEPPLTAGQSQEQNSSTSKRKVSSDHYDQDDYSSDRSRRYTDTATTRHVRLIP